MYLLYVLYFKLVWRLKWSNSCWRIWALHVLYLYLYFPLYLYLYFPLYLYLYFPLYLYLYLYFEQLTGAETKVEQLVLPDLSLACRDQLLLPSTSFAILLLPSIDFAIVLLLTQHHWHCYMQNIDTSGMRLQLNQHHKHWSCYTHQYFWYIPSYEGTTHLVSLPMIFRMQNINMLAILHCRITISVFVDILVDLTNT